LLDGLREQEVMAAIEMCAPITIVGTATTRALPQNGR
jgi:hypothetical protein